MIVGKCYFISWLWKAFLSRDLKYGEKILWLLEAGGQGDRTLFWAERTPLSSLELYLDVLPSESGGHSVAPEHR